MPIDQFRGGIRAPIILEHDKRTCVLADVTLFCLNAGIAAMIEPAYSRDVFIGFDAEIGDAQNQSLNHSDRLPMLAPTSITVRSGLHDEVNAIALIAMASGRLY